MAICGWGLPACCCHPAVAGGFTYADLRGELSTHLALQALFTESPVHEPLLQAFPFPSTLGEMTLHPLSQACVFIYSSCGKWVFPPLLWSFPPTAVFTSFPAPGCWVMCCCSCQLACLFTAHMGGGSSPLSCGVFLPPPLSQAILLLVAGRAPVSAGASPARPGLFIYSSGKDSPLPLFRAQGSPPSLPRVFVVLIAYYSVSLFSPSGDWSFQVAMLIWPRDVCGSTAYHLAHLVCIFPSHLSAGDWQPRGPPGFSVQREVEMLCAWWRCGGVKVLPLLSGLACKVCFQHLSKISL
jgi:hypothetical protein